MKVAHFQKMYEDKEMTSSLKVYKNTQRASNTTIEMEGMLSKSDVEVKHQTQCY